jgi:hypothetical protein
LGKKRAEDLRVKFNELPEKIMESKNKEESLEMVKDIIWEHC